MIPCFGCGKIAEADTLVDVAGYRDARGDRLRLHHDCAVGLAADVLTAVRVRPPRRLPPPATPATRLSPFELLVLEGIVRSETNTQIALRLGRSENTVRNVVSSMLMKMEAESRTGAAVKAVYTGIVVPEI